MYLAINIQSHIQSMNTYLYAGTLPGNENTALSKSTGMLLLTCMLYLTLL